jgi:dephospho-CoA kinase
LEQGHQQMVVLKVGITGGMGSGKSMVSAFLHDILGGLYLNADHICRELLEPGEEGWVALKKILAAELFENDILNRSLFRKLLFDDPVLRKKVDDTLHPMARQTIKKRLQESNGNGSHLIAVVEVPLLYEAGWQDDFDRVIVVHADRQSCIKRVAERDNVSIDDAALSYDVQLPLEEKIKLADYTVNNDNTWEDTCRQLQGLANKLSRLAAEQKKNRKS